MKRAVPKNRWMPARARFMVESVRLMRAVMRRMRSIAARKSSLTSAGATAPKFTALRMSASSRPVRIKDLEGMQPSFRQSPPS